MSRGSFRLPAAANSSHARIARRGFSVGHAYRKVFQLGDVENGTAGKVLGKSIGIEVQTDFDDVFPDERHVMSGDVVVGAVGEADTERVERFGPK